MSEALSHPGSTAIPGERPAYTEAQRAEIAETRELLAELAALAEEDEREGRGSALETTKLFWDGLDEWKVAGVIRAGDLHRLPEFVARIATRDTRAAIREALAHDATGLETAAELHARHHVHLRELGVSDDETLRQHAHAISVNLFARARDKIEAKERPPLNPDEVHFAAFVASHIPTEKAIEALLYFAATSPEVAEALMDNPVLKNSPTNGELPDYIERLQGVLRKLLISVRQSNGRHMTWKGFLLKAHALTRGRAELKRLGEEVEDAIRLTPRMVQALIEDEAIPNAIIQRIVSINLIRQMAGNREWETVFRSLRLRRYELFRGAIEKECRAHGSQRLIAFLDRPFGGTF